MSRLNAGIPAATVFLPVFLTALVALISPVYGVEAAHGYPISSLSSVVNPDQIKNPEAPDQVPANGAERCLGEVLLEDGSLDLTSDFHGTLDGRGYRLVSGPDEPPRFKSVSAAGDEGWADEFGSVPGTNNSVYALALDGKGNLYAGGAFTMAGGVAANCIAKWNGSSWAALGSGMSRYINDIASKSPYVSALAVDGSGNVYAGGRFATAGGVAVNNIAKWNGTSWEALGSGISSRSWTSDYPPCVRALAIDSSGDLYAGGNFTKAGGISAKHVAKWNGSSWEALGGGMGGSEFDHGYERLVRALAVDGNGNLYAGGTFKKAGGVTANNIAKWNGSSWEALGSGMNGDVHALAIDGSGSLYAGGEFTSVNGVVATYVAAWHTDDWLGLYFGTVNGLLAPVESLAIDENDNLYAAGTFSMAGGIAAKRIAKWNGSSWEPLGGGITGAHDNDSFSYHVSALASDGSGNLYAGGSFTVAGGVAANRIAKWNGSSWEALGSGMDGDVRALAIDSSGNLYAGGSFTVAGGVAANRIAKWNGSSWEALGSGMDSAVSALAIDGNGNLYAGGSFSKVGGVAAKRIAKWNGSSWQALGSGMTGGVSTLAIDGSGNLYAGGSFSKAGGVAAKRIAKWNGSSWESLGGGVSGASPLYYYVYTLALDGSGNLYAGGDFIKAGKVAAKYIAKWNGSSWEALGSGTNNPVEALVVDSSGSLYAGGAFTTAGGKASAYIARWEKICAFGSLKVKIIPKDAVVAGGRWRVDNGAWKKSGATVTELPVGPHTVAFKAVSGWVTPAKQTVTIVAGEATLANVTYETLNAGFSGTPTSGKVGLRVKFTDESVGPVKSWLWVFGDKGTSRSKNPGHIYSQPGTYSVTLTVKNGKCAHTTTKTNYITIYPAISHQP